MTQKFDHIAIEKLIPSPTNPRKTFDEAALNELAESIRNQGIVQPILVRKAPPELGTAGQYEIVAGERRWRAARSSERSAIPCPTARQS